MSGKLLAGLSVVLFGGVLCCVVSEKSFTLDRFHPCITQRVNRQRAGFEGDSEADAEEDR